MSKRVLITGACGFFGRNMCNFLSAQKESCEIIGADISDASLPACDSYQCIDLTDSQKVGDFIKAVRPDYIIHFAGAFHTENYHEILKCNTLPLMALLEAACNFVPDAVIITAGSAAEYGRIAPEQLPVTEQTPCLPIMPYGLSKQIATEIAQFYYRVHGMQVMVVRPFQLIGKGVTTRLAPGAFAEQLKQVLAQHGNTIKVGDLNSSRDFLDIHDAVQAVWALCSKPSSGEVFNLCSGQPTKMADLLNMMIQKCGAKVIVEVDPARLRNKVDVSCIYGSFEKLHDHCGWTPKNKLQDSVAQMFQ